MKKNILKTTIFIALTSVLFFVSCKNKENSETIFFSAEIENPNGDSLFIETLYGADTLKTFHLDNGKLSKDIVKLPMGFYRINDCTETTICFLKPNFDLHLDLNTKEFDETIKYSGKGSIENNYLAKKYLLEESFQDINYYGYYASLGEKDFLLFSDSIYNLYLELFNKHKNNFDEDFTRLEAENLKMGYLTKIANYESMHGFITGNRDFQVSDNFPNPFKKIDLEDEQLLIVPGYIYFINLYLQELSSNKCKEGSSLSYYNTFIDFLDSVIQNKKIKEEVANYFGLYTFSEVKDKDYCYAKLKEMISNPEYLIPIEEIYSKLQKIKSGAISPTFELYDIDSNLVKLDDFKGKLVYIDIWATWCKPCIKEIPSLDKLQTELKDKNIVFISICQNDDKKRWRKTVIANELQGIQLFVDDIDNKFLSDYIVSGIPRFILIDKNGFIIDSEAKRPSTPALKEQLEVILIVIQQQTTPKCNACIQENK